MKTVNRFKRNALARKAKAVEKRITALERENLRSQNVDVFKSEVGGKHLSIPKQITEEEFRDYERLLNLVFKDVYSSVGGARETEKYRRENIRKRLQAATGQNVTPELVAEVSMYVPWDDKKIFLESYEYEEILLAAQELITRGVPYNYEYMEEALKNNLKGVLRNILLDEIPFTNEEKEDYLPEHYVELAEDNDIQYAVNQYYLDKIQKQQEDLDNDTME